MSKKLFSDKEVSRLAKNKNILKVSNKSITYSFEFKKKFIDEYKSGKLPRVIFEEAGLDTEILGIRRIKTASDRWRKAFKQQGELGLKDHRKESSGRPVSRELTDSEKIKRLEAQIEYLKIENEFLKKLDEIERGGCLNKSEIFKAIELVVKKYKLKSKIKFLCLQAGVSRSGYYNYLNSEEARSKKEVEDLKSKKIILKAFNKKGVKKGARSIRMVLENDYNTIFNLKKIRRIMKKYHVVCPHRKPNPYKNIAKATKEHSTVENVLNRKFKQATPGKVLLTDISYLTYGSGKRAYFSAIKDGSTNEILAYEVSHSLSLDIALDTVKRLTRRRFKLHPDCLLHSDQGFHYTSPKFQRLVKEKGINQSMSRRGNCWDNAPMESFFGHMKDEINLKPLKTLEEVKREVSRYMNYYNNHRYQWDLKKMTPVQYRNHLLSA